MQLMGGCQGDGLTYEHDQSSVSHHYVSLQRGEAVHDVV
jgi:hypothetical protein